MVVLLHWGILWLRWVRISTTLQNELKRRKKVRPGTMCIGVGQGAAVIYEGLF